MGESIEESITTILRAAGLDDPAKMSKLLPIVYEDLRALARGKIAHFARQTLAEPTALVHDAWIKLFGAAEASFADRREFFIAAARAMHNILVDQARKRGALRQGGDRVRLDIESLDVAMTADDKSIAAVHEALERLDEDERRLVELRFFAGLDMEETAAALDVPLRTLEREWQMVRARLYRELTR